MWERTRPPVDPAVLARQEETEREVQAALAAYNPLTGEGYSALAAARAWSESAARSRPRWHLRGNFPDFYWSFFNFKSYTGRVSVEVDGFHWSTQAYDNRAGDEIYHEGVTTSLYEAYQSVEQNRVVKYERAS
jgi:hypothetical protein